MGDPGTTARSHAKGSALSIPGVHQCDFHERAPCHPVERGGSTDLENLAMLCEHHHHLVHSSGWSVSGNTNEELRFVGPNGHVSTSRPSRLWTAVTARARSSLSADGGNRRGRRGRAPTSPPDLSVPRTASHVGVGIGPCRNLWGQSVSKLMLSSPACSRSGGRGGRIGPGSERGSLVSYLLWHGLRPDRYVGASPSIGAVTLESSGRPSDGADDRGRAAPGGRTTTPSRRSRMPSSTATAPLGRTGYRPLGAAHRTFRIVFLGRLRLQHRHLDAERRPRRLRLRHHPFEHLRRGHHLRPTRSRPLPGHGGRPHRRQGRPQEVPDRPLLRAARLLARPGRGGAVGLALARPAGGHGGHGRRGQRHVRARPTRPSSPPSSAGTTFPAPSRSTRPR